ISYHRLLDRRHREPRGNETDGAKGATDERPLETQEEAIFPANGTDVPSSCGRSGGLDRIYVESPKGQPPQYCTAFLHFPKSGGSSVKNQLIESSHIDGSNLPSLITGVRRTTPEKRLQIVHNSSVIMGYVEMLRLPLEDIGRSCEYFTMVRNPIDRLVSAFYFCPDDKVIKDHRPKKWCGDAPDQPEPLEDRLVEFAKFVWGNSAYHLMMHSFLCDPRFELCKPQHVRDPRHWPKNIDTVEGWTIMEGIKELLATYTAVGILEEWDLSMQLFD
ncbi:unnamed protein product, partial [Laminaria digitata]